MGRVSLTEAYDDRSVIAKLNEMDKRVKENAVVVTSAEASAKASAQAAQETADRFAGSVGAVVQNANQQINASKAQVDQAKAEVDATVTTVAQAVQTANNASASAQQSAQTVAEYENRLSVVEGDVTALETADGQNVKLTGNASVYGRKAFNAISTRNVNGQGDATSSLELFRFRPVSGQDHRFNFFCQLGMGVCLTFLRVQISNATVTIIDGTKTPIGNSSGNITIGTGMTADGWCVVYEKENASCIFCSLLTAFTGSRFPIKEANIDMSKQCNIVNLGDLSGIKEVTL